jgi:hypothetical protein
MPRYYDAEMRRQKGERIANKMEGYAGREEARKMMAEDSHLIGDDRSAPCNLPRNVIDKNFPDGHIYGHNYVPSDLFNGVQAQLKEDGRDYKREAKPKKY